jgi:hypothetical protein
METADLRGAIEKSIVVDIDVGRCTELNAQTMEKVFDFLNDTAEVIDIIFSYKDRISRTARQTDRQL